MNNKNQHAEEAAVKKLIRVSKYSHDYFKSSRDYKLLVWRIGLDGNLNNSRPCESCIKYMNKISTHYKNLKHIQYSIRKTPQCVGIINTTLEHLNNDDFKHRGRRRMYNNT